jgi:hypothetical protein
MSRTCGPRDMISWLSLDIGDNRPNLKQSTPQTHPPIQHQQQLQLPSNQPPPRPTQLPAQPTPNPNNQVVQPTCNA